MRKKLYVLLAMLLVAVMVLSACSSGQSTATTQPSTGQTEVTQAPAEATQAPAEATEAPTEAATEASGEVDCASPDVFCVGLVTDVGQIDDKSFNQSAWEGVKMALDKGVADKIDYIETTDAKDYEANIELFAQRGYDVIVTVGFALGQATNAMAKKYPNIDFIGVDQFQAWAVDDDKTNDLPNMAGLIFHEDQAGFMAGALAGMLTQTGTIAAVLGTDLVPPVVAFKEGYEAGAKYIKPDIKVISTYHPGGLENAFTDPEWGAATARQAMDQGADVIFGAGGKTGNGALIEVASAAKSGKHVYCIGVDTDQWYTVPEAHACLVSSAMKLITPGVFDLIQKAKDGQFPSGNYFGEVGLAPFHDFDSKIPQEVKDKLKEIREGLLNGTIDTGYKPGG